MKPWKVVIGVLLVFFLGALIGALGTHRYTMKRLHAMAEGPVGIRQAMVRGLTWRLRLTPAQQVETDNAIREAQKEFQGIRNEVQPRVEVILHSAQDRIRAQLDIKQREKFDKIVAEHKGRWQNMQVE